jgi:hypothetical protein
MKYPPIESWLKDNSWNLLVTFVAIIIAWTLFNSRLQAVEASISQYPSYDYFELRFKQIESSIQELKVGQEAISDKLDNHLQEK